MSESVQGVSRFTVSVPSGLLEEVDQKLAGGAKSRSAVVRRLLEEALRALEEQEQIEQYVTAYRRQPQTEEEFGWSDAATLDRLVEAAWS